MDWNFRNDQPIYSQLTQRLTEAIVSGIYAPGEKLPSVRELAVEAGVNPNTVQRALSELERDGLVFSQRTAGRFVTENENKCQAPHCGRARGRISPLDENARLHERRSHSSHSGS